MEHCTLEMLPFHFKEILNPSRDEAPILSDQIIAINEIRRLFFTIAPERLPFRGLPVNRE